MDCTLLIGGGVNYLRRLYNLHSEFKIRPRMWSGLSITYKLKLNKPDLLFLHNFRPEMTRTSREADATKGFGLSFGLGHGYHGGWGSPYYYSYPSYYSTYRPYNSYYGHTRTTREADAHKSFSKYIGFGPFGGFGISFGSGHGYHGGWGRPYYSSYRPSYYSSYRPYNSYYGHYRR